MKKFKKFKEYNEYEDSYRQRSDRFEKISEKKIQSALKQRDASWLSDLEDEYS